jgi:hypothetical protein
MPNNRNTRRWSGKRQATLTFTLTTLESVINPIRIKSDDRRTVNHDYRGGHVTEFLEIDQGGGILGYVLFQKRNFFLRKKLFRLVAEHSAVLAVNSHALHSSVPCELLDGVLGPCGDVGHRLRGPGWLGWRFIPERTRRIYRDVIP